MPAKLEFDCDPAKAAANFVKHQVAFEEAMTIFADPLALSRPDNAPGSTEERWITIGLSRATKLLLVAHTHVELSQDQVKSGLFGQKTGQERKTRL